MSPPRVLAAMYAGGVRATLFVSTRRRRTLIAWRSSSFRRCRCVSPTTDAIASRSSARRSGRWSTRSSASTRLPRPRGRGRRAASVARAVGGRRPGDARTRRAGRSRERGALRAGARRREAASGRRDRLHAPAYARIFEVRGGSQRFISRFVPGARGDRARKLLLERLDLRPASPSTSLAGGGCRRRTARPHATCRSSAWSRRRIRGGHRPVPTAGSAVRSCACRSATRASIAWRRSATARTTSEPRGLLPRVPARPASRRALHRSRMPAPAPQSRAFSTAVDRFTTGHDGRFFADGGAADLLLGAGFPGPVAPACAWRFPGPRHDGALCGLLFGLVRANKRGSPTLSEPLRDRDRFAGADVAAPGRFGLRRAASPPRGSAQSLTDHGAHLPGRGSLRVRARTGPRLRHADRRLPAIQRARRGSPAPR